MSDDSKTIRHFELAIPFDVEFTTVEFDLSAVTKPEQLRDALAKHIDLPPDWRDMGRQLSEFLHYQERPYTGREIKFRGWSVFETHMPKRAKQLKRFFDNYARRHPHALVVEYL